jgi:hypothetical protein
VLVGDRGWSNEGRTGGSFSMMIDDLSTALPRGKENLEYMYDGAAEAPSSTGASREASLFVLMGVQAGSSAGRKDP